MTATHAAFLFPGQASQRVGMGKDLVDRYPVARGVFEEADETLGFSLSKLCFEGPMEELTETRNAQPAILVHSTAVARILDEAKVKPALVAGHSLGEFSAACSVGVLSFADALRTVRRRGELMWEAGQRVPGTMAAVVGFDLERCQEICAELSDTGDGVVVVANLNSPQQLVISGDVAAVDRAREALADAGARRVMPLPVSGAFHSPLMKVVQAEFADFLGGLEFRDATAPVVCNVSAEPESDGNALRENFVQQLVSPVRWHDSVEAMVNRGAQRFVEAGPGNVLSNLGSRGFRSSTFFSTSEAEPLEKVLAEVRGGG